MFFALVLFAAADLVELHGVDGHVVQVNPDQVTSLRPRTSGEHFTEKAQCLVNLTDGKYVTVTETCDKVRLLLGHK